MATVGRSIGYSLVLTLALAALAFLVDRSADPIIDEFEKVIVPCQHGERVGVCKGDMPLPRALDGQVLRRVRLRERRRVRHEQHPSRHAGHAVGLPMPGPPRWAAVRAVQRESDRERAVRGALQGGIHGTGLQPSVLGDADF